MRIMFSVHTYYPDNNGVQIVTEYMAEGIAKYHDVCVVSEYKDSLPLEEKYNGVTIKRIKVTHEGFGFAGEKDKYYQYIKEYNPDVLICVCLQSWPFDWICDKLDDLKCKKILYTHGSSAYFEHYPIVRDILGLRLNAFKYHLYWKKYYDNAYKYMSKFDKVIYLSKSNSSYIYARKYKLNNDIIIPNAVEDDFFNEPAEHNNESINFVYVSNYDENKNQKDVLKAYYRADVKNAKMTFIGGQSSNYYKKLCSLNEELKQADEGKHKVEIIYGMPRNEIKSFLSTQDVFICGSTKEQYPLMLCEAAAKKLAIISTDVGHARELPGCIVVNDFANMAKVISLLDGNKKLIINNSNLLREYACENYRIDQKINELIRVISLLI